MFPQLPKLISLELKVRPAFPIILPEWLPVTLVQLVGTLPALRRLSLELMVPAAVTRHALDSGFLDSPQAGPASILSTLDDALHGTVERLVWNLTLTEATVASSEFVVARFRAAVEDNMVRMHAAGAIEVAYLELRVNEATLP